MFSSKRMSLAQEESLSMLSVNRAVLYGGWLPYARQAIYYYGNALIAWRVLVNP